MSMKEDFLSMHGYDDWSTDGLGVLICPCGNRVEDDGQCPNGHVSPMRQEGFI
jgi:hypothetical protein